MALTKTQMTRLDLAQALHKAYKGELEFQYNRDDNLLRASWSRRAIPGPSNAETA